jgi:PleD family two-component response regulator
MWSPHVVQAWVAFFRGHLRGTDLAGRLSSGDIGVLLTDTTLEGADVVARRIRKFIITSTGAGPAPALRIGVSSRAPGVTSTASLLAQALAAAASIDRHESPSDTAPTERAR